MSLSAEVISERFLLPETIPIGKRTGFVANAAAAPIKATPAKAFKATAFETNVYTRYYV